MFLNRSNLSWISSTHKSFYSLFSNLQWESNISYLSIMDLEALMNLDYNLAPVLLSYCQIQFANVFLPATLLKLINFFEFVDASFLLSFRILASLMRELENIGVVNGSPIWDKMQNFWSSLIHGFQRCPLLFLSPLLCDPNQVINRFY